MVKIAGPSTTAITPGISWQTVDYDDKAALVEALRGIHTLLSFVQILSDPDQRSQRNLIDADISADITRNQCNTLAP
ncbi:hypothetical protein PAAG_12604 [Paracoccidioides lutzii Pb01]|uniref:Uncharacterized protein n=1 Tax=Paracoccidioides lutzii (strain ATCC MYA-826 / Pb01) TaxID=502779 RepID=A0A0A2UYU3_PARBA|nr:hypothetical protein PAAG_12604 [Paracoccidioides lutzii Pb01]KGQ00726.1 hypothetical protein PAAG_12604 [Paracoccidioides lutzii Pb01]